MDFFPIKSQIKHGPKLDKYKPHKTEMSKKQKNINFILHK